MCNLFSWHRKMQLHFFGVPFFNIKNSEYRRKLNFLTCANCSTKTNKTHSHSHNHKLPPCYHHHYAQQAGSTSHFLLSCQTQVDIATYRLKSQEAAQVKIEYCKVSLYLKHCKDYALATFVSPPSTCFWSPNLIHRRLESRKPLLQQ